MVIDVDLQIDYASSINGSINSHNIYEHNGLSSLINSNNFEDSDMNWILNNDDMSCGNGFINSHTFSQFNESSYFNDKDEDVEHGDVRGWNCFMNIHTLSEAKKLSYLYSTKKRDLNVPNVSEMEDTK